MIFIFGFFPSKYVCDDCNIKDYKPLINIRLSLYLFDIGFMVALQKHQR